MAKSRQCLGIDIGSHSIRIAEVSAGPGGVEIRNLAQAPLELEPGQTEPQRQSAISSQVNALIKQGKFKTKQAVFCMSGQAVFVRQLKVPATTPDRLNRIIQFEAREQIPFPLDKTALEYQVFETENPSEVEVLLVAIRKDIVDAFMKLVRKTGIKPMAISVSSLALHNYYEVNAGPSNLLDRLQKGKSGEAKKKTAGKGLLKLGRKKKTDEAEPEEEAAGPTMEFEEIQAEVNLGASTMDLAIPKGGARRLIGFTRSIPVAGTQMDRQIRTKLNLQSQEDAMRVKEEETVILSADYELASDLAEVNMPASQAATQVADTMIAEIRRSLDFFISQPDGVAVDGIVLSGGLSKMRFLLNYLEEKMGLPVELASVKSEKISIADDLREQLPSFVIPIGLAMQGVGIGQVTIDFLPQDVKNVRALTENRMQIGVAATLLAASLFLAFNLGENYISQNEKLADSTQDLIKKSEDDSKRLTEAEKDNKDVSVKWQTLSKIYGKRAYWLDFANILYLNRPPQVILDTLVLRNNGDVLISGLAPEQRYLQRFQEDLQQQKDFVRGSNLEKLEGPLIVPPMDTKVWKFTLRIRTRVREGRYEAIKEPPGGPSTSTTATNPSTVATTGGTTTHSRFAPGGR